MVILHISNSDGKYGSAKSLMELLDCELQCGDVLPIVITPIYNEINTFCTERKIENYVVNYKSSLYPVHDNWAGLKFLIRKAQYILSEDRAKKKLDRLIDWKKVDIIHTNNSNYDIGAFFSVKYHIPHVWHLREGGLSHFHYKPYRKEFMENITQGSLYFIAISNFVKEDWVKFGISEEKIIVMYDGISKRIFVNKKNEDGKIRLVMVAAVTESKGQEQIIDAVIKLPKSYQEKILLDFYGDDAGNYANNLKDKIRQHNLSASIKFHGYTKKVEDVLNSADIGLVCSRAEGFGRVTVEYLMSGIAVLAADTGANKEVVRDKCMGEIYQYNDIEDLMKKLMYMIDNINEIRSMRKKRHEFACEEFTIQENLPKIIRFMREV